MTRTLFITFFRNIRRNKVFSFINIFGLALGFAACLITYLYISDELSYDKYHEKSDRIYRMLSHNPNRNIYSFIQPARFYDFANENTPGVEHIIRFYKWEAVLGYGDNKFHEDDVCFADPEVFDVFDWKFILGDRATALNESQSVVITQSRAKKYFGDENPLGKTLRLDNALDLLVTGVIEDVPENSHYRFGLIGSIEIVNFVNPSALTNWDNASSYYYLLLHSQAQPDLVAEKLLEIYRNAIPEGKPAPPAFALQPLEEIHLHSANVRWDIGTHGNIQTVYGFAVVAFLILLIACFNFTNLTTAGATARAREVGMKKVLGANRRSLIAQFLAETFLFSLIAMLLALIMLELAMPFFNRLTGKSLVLGFGANPQLYWVIPGMVAVVTMLAGLYPAMVLSGFHPLTILKGGAITELFKVPGKRRLQLRMRQVLIVFQFAISAGLIVAALLINDQMHFIRHKDLGFNHDAVLVIENPWDGEMRPRFERVHTDLQRLPSVTGVSGSHNLPGRNLNNYTGGFRERNAPSESGIHTGLVSVEHEFFSVMNTPIVAGRDFSKEFATDEGESCIVNQTLAAQLGDGNVVGMEVTGFYDGQPKKIIGVAQDIHFNSLHQQVTPAVFFVSKETYPHYFSNIIVRINPANIFEALGEIEEIWNELAPQWPMQSYFLDLKLNALYRQEQQITSTTNLFSGLAIFLSLMGLFGLILFVMRSRTKEIGIRQVHGATPAGLVRMFAAEFAVLMLIANLIAWPLAWLVIQNWLERFVYRVNIGIQPFVVAAVITLALSLVMVTYHVVRTLRANPVNALKYE